MNIPDEIIGKIIGYTRPNYPYLDEIHIFYHTYHNTYNMMTIKNCAEYIKPYDDYDYDICTICNRYCKNLCIRDMLDRY